MSLAYQVKVGGLYGFGDRWVMKMFLGGGCFTLISLRSGSHWCLTTSCAPQFRIGDGFRLEDLTGSHGQGPGRGIWRSYLVSQPCVRKPKLFSSWSTRFKQRLRKKVRSGYDPPLLSPIFFVFWLHLNRADRPSYTVSKRA
jgi:hypothetical protein